MIRRALLPLLAATLLAAAFPPPARAAADWPASVVDDPAQMTRREQLLSHGINPEPTALLRFLREGFSATAAPAGLPREPLLKSVVVNSVVVELGMTAEPSALPVLSDMARRRNTDAVKGILRRDFEDLPLDSRDGEIEKAERVLALNAVVALGLIGDRSAEAAILEAMTLDKATGFITQGAISLALCGSRAGMEPLLDLCARVESPDCPAAFRTVFILTGRNYGVGENTPLARRRVLAEELRTWWREKGPEEPLLRAEILRRRAVAAPEAKPEPGTLRALLHANMDLSSFEGRYEARKELFATASSRFDELRAIAEDPLEDLSIRRSALRWIAVGNPRKARPILRRALKDENPAIAETAKYVLEDVPKYIEDRRKRGLE